MIAVSLVAFALLGLPPVARGAGRLTSSRSAGVLARYAIQADGQLSPLSAGIVAMGRSTHRRDTGWPVGIHRSRSRASSVRHRPLTELTRRARAHPQSGRQPFPIRHRRISERRSLPRSPASPTLHSTSIEYDIDPMTGALAFMRPEARFLAIEPGALLIAPDGKSAYVTDLDIRHPHPLQRRRAVRHRSDQQPIVHEGARGDLDRPVPERQDRPRRSNLDPRRQNVYVLNNGCRYTRTTASPSSTST